jgi:hypothetical protein
VNNLTFLPATKYFVPSHNFINLQKQLILPVSGLNIVNSLTYINIGHRKMFVKRKMFTVPQQKIYLVFLFSFAIISLGWGKEGVLVGNIKNRGGEGKR